MARIIPAILSCLLLGVALPATAEPPQSGKWQSLFNGRDLSGWTPKIVGHKAGDNFANTFRVQDGAIRVSYDGYGGQFKDRFGHLFYKTPYSHFRLRLKYRMLSPHLPDTPEWAYANSGIMLYGQTPQTMGLNQDFPASIEFQLLGQVDDKPRPTGSVCSPGTNIRLNGKTDLPHCNVSNGPTIPKGEWATAEVEVNRAGEVIHRINGLEVIRYDRITLDPNDKETDTRALIAKQGGKLALTGGTISLQSEGNPVEFKDVEIQQL